jgi:hypothetical protein
MADVARVSGLFLLMAHAIGYKPASAAHVQEPTEPSQLGSRLRICTTRGQFALRLPAMRGLGSQQPVQQMTEEIIEKRWNAALRALDANYQVGMRFDGGFSNSCAVATIYFR